MATIYVSNVITLLYSKQSKFPHRIIISFNKIYDTETHKVLLIWYILCLLDT